MIKRLPLLFATLALACGCTNPQKADYKSMFSFWTVVSAEEGGQPADPVMKADVFIDSEIQDPDGNGDIDFRWTDPPGHKMKIDVTKSPKQVDVSKGISFGGSDAVWPGIYELNGDDLKICLDLSGKVRRGRLNSKPRLATNACCWS